MARPTEYSADEIRRDLEHYIETNDDPMIEEFLLQVPYCKDTLHRYARKDDALSYTIKKLHNKQTIRTVRETEKGNIPVAWAIFKMKQPVYGWTDKQVVEQTTRETTVLEKMLEKYDINR